MNFASANLPELLAGRPVWQAVVAPALILGAAASLGQAPASIPLITLLSVLLAAVFFLQMPGAKRAAVFGWSLGLGYFSASLFWITEPFLVVPEVHGWMAPFAVFFMAGGLSLFWAAAFFAAFRMGKERGHKLIALVICFGLAELARSYLFTGFPWGLLAYIWVETPVVQLAAYVGPHGLGALTLAIALAPLAFARRPVGVIVAVMLLAASWGIGTYRQNLPDIARATPVNLRLVQPNAPQREKWDPELAPQFFQRQLDLTAAEAEITPDLVIWPEASVTFWLDSKPELQSKIAEAAPEGSQVIVGARRFSGRRFYNALVLLDDQGLAKDTYDKVRLVPFGEYIPYGSIFSRFGIYGLAADEGGGFSAGSVRRLMDLGPMGKVLPLICYEAIFPHLAAFTPRPDWILQITNDAWFGDLAGPQQHLAQARVRAIEQGLPVVRVANTGVSAVIDARGRMVDHLPLGIASKLDAQLPGHLSATLYSRTGDWGVLALLFVGLGLLVLRGRKQNID